MPTNKPEVVLPELPVAVARIHSDGYWTTDDRRPDWKWPARTDVFTADQLRAYGQTCIDTLTRPADGDFVMVPREPTEVMVAAGNEASDWHIRDADDVSRAMLSAAPQQHGQEVDDGLTAAYMLGRYDGRKEVQQPAEAVAVCETCNGHGMIGGPSYREPDESGVPCPDCAQPPQASMEDVEAQARELLAAEYEKDSPGNNTSVRLLAGESVMWWSDEIAIRAITAALANQQGVGGGDAGEANRLLREVVDNLEGVGCGPCIGSHAPMEDLHGRIERYLRTQPAGDVGSQS